MMAISVKSYKFSARMALQLNSHTSNEGKRVMNGTNGSGANAVGRSLFC